jgi:signal peptidase I
MNLKSWFQSKPKKKQSIAREWINSVTFAVVAATLIRWTTVEAFMIPTPSMEDSAMVGDFLFVSKLHYGTRTTDTPLQVPLTHQKIWLTDIPYMWTG